MNKLRKYIFVFLVQCLCIAASFSQETMRINGTQIVKKGETLTIDAGRIVEFEAGATLIVEGSIVVRGTTDQPVIMKSMDLQNPGNGIMVKGIDENGSVVMDNVRISGLIQPLRFDPFWYRKSVDLKSMVISSANSGEPVIYVAGPLLDLRDGMDIRFSMNSLKFYNNSGSVLLEKVGSDGIVYDLDKLLFSDNTLPGSDATMGVLHLDIARSVSEGQFKVGELAFNRNFSGDKSVGVSMSGGNGTGAEKFEVQGVFGNDNVSDLIYDRRANVRIPSLEVKNMAGLDKYSDEKNFIVSSNHMFGKVQMKVIGNPTVVKLEDSLGKPVYNNALRKGDTLELNYLEGNPTVVTLSNGEKFMVPKLTVSQLPSPIYRNIDTTLSGIGMTLDSLIEKIRDSLEAQDLKWKTWTEYGIWTGGAVYQGDIKHKYGILPSTIEISTGFYAQFKPFKRTAFRVTYYNAKISMHSILAPGLFSAMAPLYLPTNIGGVKGVFTPSNLWRFNFTTTLNVLDLESIIYLNRARNINFNNPNKWSMLSALGIGTSIIQYDPKRMVVTDKYTLVSLRPLGTEGQNFLPGQKPYGKITGSFNLAYNVVFQKNRWLFKGEIKKVYSFSDYLDDWGSGQWYGGDYDKWAASLPAGNIDPFSRQDMNIIAGLGEYYQVEYKDKGLDLSAKKSLTALPDGYLQFHLGVAYRIVNPVIKEKKKK
jgi:hypothetical protein